ncbi:DUF3794 and LysM peptidoglycan-binding domain-containing protein [Ruminococcus flavefaciens]|uniref:DUF3794 and LysM peptidoglycan-binding domain-containing protein n=1 Tax=Ruminococcus flavefaciens TaxID=1265 RepID=UPI0026EE67B3|nr:SPOCS domain-containing protein [Ruminococcus flavefaciens]MDD7517303.1 DUF3794 domain-containing protein [Ruminococcus flavefaciens]MDY5690834.1 DUF3794 domain-containing protein [Ruminococcus flavefaciens]
MELKLNRETVPAAEMIYDGIQEQPLELDYILPDYCPDIFRLIRCDTTPVIMDWGVSGDKLTYELRCDIHILYCGENSSDVQSVEQHRSFTKTIELGKNAESAEIRLVPKADHVNFRAVNKRRLDLRGAVSVKVTVTGQQEQEVISDAFGMNIQLKKTPVKFAAGRLSAEKNVRIEEETELGAAMPDVTAILNCRSSASQCEIKLISGKLLAKGEIDVEILYSAENSVENMRFSLGYSQIIDIDGLDDSYDCMVTPEMLSCDIAVTADKEGNNRILRCEAEIRLGCRAVRTATAMIAEDAFSTVYPCNVEISEIKAEQIPAVYDESFRHSAKLAEGDNVPQTIYAMWSAPKNINTRIGDDGRSVVISGMLTYSMAAKDKTGMMIMPDRDEAFEETIGLPDNVSGASVSAEVSVRETSYDISAEGVLTGKADIGVKLSVYSSDCIKAVTDISIDETTKKERDGDYAIKLYFGVENEDVWDIAKRYSTSVSAIMEENELSGERLENGGMLLIPIVS